MAERSGISRGSIPWHFGSKEGLLLAVLEGSVGLVHASLDDGPDPGADTGLDRMMTGLAALFAQPTTKLFVTLLVEALEPDSQIHDRYVAIHDTLRGHCKRWLDGFAPLAGVSTRGAGGRDRRGRDRHPPAVAAGTRPGRHRAVVGRVAHIGGGDRAAGSCLKRYVPEAASSLARTSSATGWPRS